MTDDSNSTESQESVTEQDGKETVIITDWKVGTDGRLHIPKEKRERYNIEEGDYLDASLVVGGER